LHFIDEEIVEIKLPWPTEETVEIKETEKEAKGEETGKGSLVINVPLFDYEGGDHSRFIATKKN
jgi:hypothetical protein